MPITINTNVSALTAQRNLSASSMRSASSLAKLSSGSRVPTAKDDAASLAVGSRLNAQVEALRQASVNAGQAISMLQIAEGAMGQIGDILVRMSSLAVQANSGQLSNSERSLLDAEFTELQSEIDRIANDTEFNGTKLINGGDVVASFQEGEVGGLDGQGINLTYDTGSTADGDVFRVDYDWTDAATDTGELTVTNLATGEKQTIDIASRIQAETGEASTDLTTDLSAGETVEVSFGALGVTVTLDDRFDVNGDFNQTMSVNTNYSTVDSAQLGNFGVTTMQILIPLVMTVGVFGALAGDPMQLQSPSGTLIGRIEAGTDTWIQNAGFIWVPFILLGTAAAWFGMNDIASARSSFKDQSVIFKRKHNWLMCMLYTGTFGSFIGYSAGFPLLASNQFPEIDVLKFAFLGPLVGALSRAGTGWVSDRFGGARVTLWVFAGMIACVAGVLFFLGIKDQPGAFWGFFAMFLLLFFFTGVGNASTFQMIPEIFRQEVARLMPSLNSTAQRQQSDKESAATIGFTSAIAAYGAFFIPKTFGSSIALTGGAESALYGFIVFYALCMGLTWFYYTRRNAETPC